MLSFVIVMREVRCSIGGKMVFGGRAFQTALWKLSDDESIRKLGIKMPASSVLQSW